MDLFADYSRAMAIFLILGGVALIMVPRWIRFAIAVLMIAIGLAELFPELTQTKDLAAGSE